MQRFDVAVIGAGPAGSSAAISLAQKGYSVILIDKRLFPREKLCGDFLNPINWPLFEQLGVANEILLLEHEEIGTFRISSFTGEEATIRFPSQYGKRCFGLGLRRYYLDDLLLRRAEKGGAVVQQNVRIQTLEAEKGGWSLTLGNHPTERRIHSTVLIGADGRNSWVAHRLGLAKAGQNPSQFLAFQLHLRGVRGVKGEVQIHLFPGGYAGLVGLGGGMVNLCFSSEKKKARDALSIEALLENHLFCNPHLRASLDQATLVGDVRSAYPVYFSPRRFYGDGILLVGDAARVTEPVTGEGVYFALKSGELAAEAIDQAFIKGDVSSRQLFSYQLACKKAFSLRQGVNGLIRMLIYHPSLLSPLIRLSARTTLPIDPLVRFVCLARPLPQP